MHQTIKLRKKITLGKQGQLKGTLLEAECSGASLAKIGNKTLS